MDRDRAEYDILKILVLTLCASVVCGIVGVAFGKVDVQFVEGLITGGLITLITNIFKDLSVKNEGGSNVQSNSTVLPEPVSESIAPKV